jgi:hypothetical protein
MSTLSVLLSDFFISIPNVSIGNIVKSIISIIKSIYDKDKMILNGLLLDTKPYKEIKLIDRKYIYAFDENKDKGSNSGNSNSANLGESSRSGEKIKGKLSVGASDIIPVDTTSMKLAEISADLDYKDSIIKDKRINSTDKLNRLEMSDHNPEKSDSSGDMQRVKELEHLFNLKRKTLESDLDPSAKLEILECLSDKTPKVYEEKTKGKVPITNLEQNPLIGSQSDSNFGVHRTVPRNNTAANLSTGSEQVFSSPPRAPHGEMPSNKEPIKGELPSIVLDLEPDTPPNFVNPDSSNQSSSTKSKLKNLFKKK